MNVTLLGYTALGKNPDILN